MKEFKNLSSKEKLKAIGSLIIYLIGGVGGGASLLEALEYFRIPDLLLSLIGLIYFCAFSMLFSKIESKEERERRLQNALDEGFQDGREAALRGFGAAARRHGEEQYNEGYNAGYERGHTVGWETGYADARREFLPFEETPEKAGE